MTVLIIIPTYNEVGNIESLLSRVRVALPEAAVLVVDDNSPDGTGQLAETIAHTSQDTIHVLHHGCKAGLGAAYIAGFRYALDLWPEIEFVIQMDGDFSHDPAYLRPLLQKCREGDIIVGSRYMNGISIVNWPLHRLVVSKIGTTYARVLTGLPIKDCTSGFKCIRAAVLKSFDLGQLRSSGYAFQIEFLFRAYLMGYRIQEEPIIFYERRCGHSKLNLSIAGEAFALGIYLAMLRVLHRLRPSMFAHRELIPPDS